MVFSQTGQILICFSLVYCALSFGLGYALDIILLLKVKGLKPNRLGSLRSGW